MTEVSHLKAKKQTLAQEINEQEGQKKEMEACLTYLRHEYDQIQADIADMNSQVFGHPALELGEIDEQLIPSGLS
jgi:septal ring factor EnvC (AmiA/AmiB activator)